jgi:hypothetical protein
MGPSSELVTAVKLNETRLHELMRLTGATPPADLSAIEAALTAAVRQLDAVMNNASRSERRVRQSESSPRRVP